MSQRPHLNIELFELCVLNFKECVDLTRGVRNKKMLQPLLPATPQSARDRRGFAVRH